MILAGCASLAERAGEEAAPAGLQASLEALQEEQTRQQLADVVALVTNETMATMLERLDDLSPQVEDLARQAAAVTVHEMLNDEHQAEAAQFAERLTRAILSEVIETSATGLREQIGPAIEHLLKEHVAPAHRLMVAQEAHGRVEALAEPEAQQLAAAASRNAARAGALGLQDAMAERNILLILGLGAAGLVILLLLGAAGIVWLAMRMNHRQQHLARQAVYHEKEDTGR